MIFSFGFSFRFILSFSFSFSSSNQQCGWFFFKFELERDSTRDWLLQGLAHLFCSLVPVSLLVQPLFSHPLPWLEFKKLLLEKNAGGSAPSSCHGGWWWARFEKSFTLESADGHPDSTFNSQPALATRWLATGKKLLYAILHSFNRTTKWLPNLDQLNRTYRTKSGFRSSATAKASFG